MGLNTQGHTSRHAHTHAPTHTHVFIHTHNTRTHTHTQSGRNQSILRGRALGGRDKFWEDLIDFAYTQFTYEFS